jgi:hypothetical protein
MWESIVKLFFSRSHDPEEDTRQSHNSVARLVSSRGAHWFLGSTIDSETTQLTFESATPVETGIWAGSWTRRTTISNGKKDRVKDTYKTESNKRLNPCRTKSVFWDRACYNKNN